MDAHNILINNPQKGIGILLTDLRKLEEVSLFRILTNFIYQHKILSKLRKKKTRIFHQK